MAATQWHEWMVAGALVESPDGLLLVRNMRRGGSEDWSTPGGVIDAADDSILAGLVREVAEETGLVATGWHGPVYKVIATAPDMGWRMRCEVHLARTYEGELAVDDPDGIVVEAAFVPPHLIDAHLQLCPQWVREPLASWLGERWTADVVRTFEYTVYGNRRDELRVERHVAR